MKKIMFTILFIVSCTNLTAPEKNQKTVSKKEAVILTYFQRVDHYEIVNDSHAAVMNACPIIYVDIFVLPDKSKQIENMKEFVGNKMDTQSVVLLSNVLFRPTMVVGDDHGGQMFQSAISIFPFTQTTTDIMVKTHLNFL
jgi:hypothetical protein